MHSTVDFSDTLSAGGVSAVALYEARVFGDHVAHGPQPMRFHAFRLSSIALASVLPLACAEKYPDAVALAPGAEVVEVASDRPNPELYEPVGGVAARILGNEVSAAVRQAKNELRNQAAQRGATFVSIDEISTRPSWDLRGHTVVIVTGTAFRVR